MSAPTLTEQQYYLLGMLSKGVIGYGEGGGSDCSEFPQKKIKLVVPSVFTTYKIFNSAIEISANQSTFSSSDFSSAYDSLKAFDKDENTYWAANGNVGQFLGVKLNIAYPSTLLQILDKANRLQAFVFEGSNDGSNYVEIISATRPIGTDWKDFEHSNTTPYLYYRIRCSGSLYSGSNVTISEVRIFYRESEE